MLRVLFAAGGSIGHIAPCVAVWRAVQKIKPVTEAHFVCSTREEDIRFLQKEGVICTALGGRGISIWTLPAILSRAWKVLSHVTPDVIFTKGGGVTVPIALAGWMRGIPIVVHESDAIPGRATRLLSTFATHVVQGFPANPIRPEILRGSRERGLALTGFSGDRPILLVMGGSQGAAALNDAVAAKLDELLVRVDIVHITGKGKSGASAQPGKYWTCEFAHKEYPHLLAIADIALSRAGAGSISELAVSGIAAILVPLRGLAHDHQERNARAMEEKDACVVIEQDSLVRALLPAVKRFLDDPPLLQHMQETMHTLAGLDASRKVAEILLAISNEHGRVP